MKELAEKAAVAELGQHLPVAQDILGGADAPKVVAFLLKSYFNAQADISQRRTPQVSADSESGEPSGERREGRGRSRGGRGRGESSGEGRREGGGEAVQARPAGDAGEGGEDGEGGRRRRRRRRGRGRGEGGEPRVQSGGNPGYDVVDARDLLGERPARPAAQPREEGNGNAPSRGNESRGRGGRDGGRGGRDDSRDNDSRGNEAPVQSAPAPAAPSAPTEAPADGLTRIRVNIGFDDGFKGRGAVAKKISALAGLNEGIVTEVEARRDHAVLKATPEIAELVLERVDGAQLGKKVIAVSIT